MFLFKFILIVIQMVKNFDGTKIIRQEFRNMKQKCGQLSSTRYDLQNTSKCNIKVRFDVIYRYNAIKWSNEDLKVLMLVGKMLCIDMS